MYPQDILLVSQEPLDRMPKLSLPLLEWYDKNARILPWRIDPTPYHVWISEIMLQQTRVEAVKGYYTRFLEALPDIVSLAHASDDLLLKLWEGLGYYNRARNLKKAARTVVEQFDGALPASYSALLSLPGIGEYTAGAISSIAFGIPVPAVDGNVLRVFSRILASHADIGRADVKKAFQQLVPTVIPPARPGDFNQAVMELGATVCLPNGAPLCQECPVDALCEANQNGIQLDLPVKSAKKARRMENRTIVIVLSQNGVLLSRRGSGLLGGMYEPLNLDGALDAPLVKNAVSQLGGTVEKLIPLRHSKHIFTHVEWHMHGFVAYTPSFSPPGEHWIWADSRRISGEIALPSAFRAYTKHLLQWLEELE